MTTLGVPASPSGHSSKTEPKVSALRVSVPNARLKLEDITPAMLLAFGKRSSVRRIQDEVADFYGVPAEYMRLPDRIGTREPWVSRPRQVAMFFARTLTKLPLTEIGRRFGGRDHSTVIHAKRAVERRAADDPFLEMELEVLRDRLTV